MALLWSIACILGTKVLERVLFSRSSKFKIRKWKAKRAERGQPPRRAHPVGRRYRLATSLHRGRWRIPPIPAPFFSLAHKAYNRRRLPFNLYLTPQLLNPNSLTHISTNFPTEIMIKLFRHVKSNEIMLLYLV